MRRPPVALLVALVLALAACSSGSGGGRAETSPSGTTGGRVSTPSPERSKEERVLAEVTVQPPSYVADPRERYVPMWEELGRPDPSYSFDAKNPNGQLAPMLIVDGKMVDDGLWLEVLLPIRPNGSSAWVRSEDVRVQQRPDLVEVDLSKRTLTRYRNGEVVDRLSVAVGSPQTPTGTGTFYVWVKVPFENPNQPYGVYALGLSGFSPVLSDWPGEGRMAIHGTPYASDRGRAVSHGCVRVYNPDMETLKDLPLGTPVIISR